MATPISKPSKVGKRGTLVIPVKLRNQYGVKDGSLVIAEATPEGILVRFVIAMSTTVFTQEQVEELLLEGIASGDSTERTPRDWDELRQVVQTFRETQ